MIAGVNVCAACGKSVMQKRIIPYVPTLSRTPSNKTEVAGVADLAAVGSHVCSGHKGALIANATKNPRKSIFSVAESI